MGISWLWSISHTLRYTPTTIWGFANLKVIIVTISNWWVHYPNWPTNNSVIQCSGVKTPLRSNAQEQQQFDILCLNTWVNLSFQFPSIRKARCSIAYVQEQFNILIPEYNNDSVFQYPSTKRIYWTQCSSSQIEGKFNVQIPKYPRINNSKFQYQNIVELDGKMMKAWPHKMPWKLSQEGSLEAWVKEKLLFLLISLYLVFSYIEIP